MFTIRLPFGHAHLPAGALVPAGHAATVSASADPFVQEALRWLPGTAQDAGGTAARAVHEEITPGNDADPSAQAGRALPARVLVADDNADMREYLARLLRSAGYRVTTVTDGQAALDAVRSDAPDLVISDVMMPRLDGLGLVAALRADARTAAVPVLLLSARAGQRHPSRACGRAPTTTWSSRSPRPSCWPGHGPAWSWPGSGTANRSSAAP